MNHDKLFLSFHRGCIAVVKEVVKSLQVCFFSQKMLECKLEQDILLLIMLLFVKTLYSNVVKYSAFKKNKHIHREHKIF